MDKKQVKKDMDIREKLLKLQTELKAPKDKYNSFGKYSYRSAEGILEAVKPHLTELGATITIYEDFIPEGNAIQSSAILTCVEKGGSISATAFAGIEKAGGMALPQAFGSASSYAKKYALGNLLLIDDTQDADATNTHRKDTKSTSKPKLDQSHPKWGAIVSSLKSGKVSLGKVKETFEVSSSVDKILASEAKKK